MAALTGKGGTVLIGSVPVLTLNEWSLDIDNNLHDVTTFSTADVVWRSFAAGLNSGSGSLNGFWDIGGGSTAQEDMQDNILTPASATIVLEVDQTLGGKYSGTAFLSRQSVGVPIDGMATVNWDLQFSGAVTYATAT